MDITEKIEELLLADQGLDGLASAIRELSELALANMETVNMT